MIIANDIVYCSIFKQTCLFSFLSIYFYILEHSQLHVVVRLLPCKINMPSVTSICYLLIHVDFHLLNEKKISIIMVNKKNF